MADKDRCHSAVFLASSMPRKAHPGKSCVSSALTAIPGSQLLILSSGICTVSMTKRCHLPMVFSISTGAHHGSQFAGLSELLDRLVDAGEVNHVVAGDR